jgi:hypothetical protein
MESPPAYNEPRVYSRNVRYYPSSSGVESASDVFSVGRNALVWDEAANLYQELMQAEGWMGKKEMMISAINSITTKVLCAFFYRRFFLFISSCGSGRLDPHSPVWIWAANLVGHASSNVRRDAVRRGTRHCVRVVHCTAGNATVDVHASDQKVCLTSALILLCCDSRYRLRNIETAYTSLAAFMKVLISTRRKELAEEQYGNLERKDLFRLMIRASEGEEKLQMTDDELVR